MSVCSFVSFTFSFLSIYFYYYGCCVFFTSFPSEINFLIVSSVRYVICNGFSLVRLKCWVLLIIILIDNINYLLTPLMVLFCFFITYFNEQYDDQFASPSFVGLFICRSIFLSVYLCVCFSSFGLKNADLTNRNISLCNNNNKIYSESNWENLFHST